MNHKELKAFITDKLTEMYKVSSSKNDDYASSEDALSNFKESAAFAGVTPAQSAMVLIGTKISRIKNLVNSGSTPNNESIEDSLKDLRIYTILPSSNTCRGKKR